MTDTTQSTLSINAAINIASDNANGSTCDNSRNSACGIASNLAGNNAFKMAVDIDQLAQNDLSESHTPVLALSIQGMSQSQQCQSAPTQSTPTHELGEACYPLDALKDWYDSATGRYCFDVGIDEAGRGPIYGSVVAAATILPLSLSTILNVENETIQGRGQAGLMPEINAKNNISSHLTDALWRKEADLWQHLTDSKKLTDARRRKLSAVIKVQSLGYAIAAAPANMIDDINILQATLLAMRNAAEALILDVLTAVLEYESSSKAHYSNTSVIQVGFRVLVDGNQLPTLEGDAICTRLKQALADQGKLVNLDRLDLVVKLGAWVKGDARHRAIAAASVLAKVARDEAVCADALRYPLYGLEKHKGYPTKAHLQALTQFGVLPEHRRSFSPVLAALQHAETTK